MSWLRPPVEAFLRRWAETGLALLIAGFGLWSAAGGGWIARVAGLCLALGGGGWALLALRRARFQRGAGAWGLVVVVERSLRYLHPTRGGEISLDELADLHLLWMQGRAVWQIRDLHGHQLLVPLDAGGAAALFDAFTLLPGLSSTDLVAALRAGEPAAAETNLPVEAFRRRLVWQRKGAALQEAR